MGPIRISTILCYAASTVSCGSSEGLSPRQGQFEDLFDQAGTIVLEEPDSAPLTGIQSLAPGLDGGLVIVDKGRSQTRLHGADGSLQRIVGRFGGAPGEFRKPMDARYDSLGRLYIGDAEGSRITRFNPELSYDTIFRAPGMLIYEMDWASDGLFVTMWNGLSVNPFFNAVVDTSSGATLARVGQVDSVLWEVPYWQSFGQPIGAASASFMITGNYLLYPFHLYDSAGRFNKDFGAPPPRYKAPQALELGAFTGPDGGERMREWLRSHTRVSRLDIYRDSLIFVVHADPDPTPADLYGHIDRSLDIYDGHGMKLWFDIPLPGVRVLRTEDYLYILETMPPDGPWTIGKYKIRNSSPS